MTTLRLYSVYGPWEDPRRLVPTLIARTDCAESCRRSSTRDTARDFVYVDDVCDAFLDSRRRAAGPRPHLQRRQRPPDHDARARRACAAGFSIEAEPPGAPIAASWDTEVWVADSGRIGRELGWHATRGLREGLTGLAGWLSERPEVWERYGVAALGDGYDPDVPSGTVTPIIRSKSEQPQLRELPAFSGRPWQMSYGERTAIEGMLAMLQPKLSIEIGRAEGGSLRRIAAHSDRVISFDILEPTPEIGALENVTALAGDSHQMLPAELERLAGDSENVDFALVDGDHTAEGVRADMMHLLESDASSAP